MKILRACKSLRLTLRVHAEASIMSTLYSQLQELHNELCVPQRVLLDDGIMRGIEAEISGCASVVQFVSGRHLGNVHCIRTCCAAQCSIGNPRCYMQSVCSHSGVARLSRALVQRYVNTPMQRPSVDRSAEGPKLEARKVESAVTGFWGRGQRVPTPRRIYGACGAVSSPVATLHPLQLQFMLMFCVLR